MTNSDFLNSQLHYAVWKRTIRFHRYEDKFNWTKIKRKQSIIVSVIWVLLFHFKRYMLSILSSLRGRKFNVKAKRNKEDLIGTVSFLIKVVKQRIFNQMYK